MSRQPGLRAQGLSELWGLRLARANGSEEAKAALQADWNTVVSQGNDGVAQASSRGAVINS